MDLTPFGQKLTITAIDKGILGLLLVVAGFAFNKMIEKQQHDGLCACPGRPHLGGRHGQRGPRSKCAYPPA